MKNVIKTAIGGLLFLTSCHVFSAASDLNVKSINIPAYNLITDTLTSINAANGKRNDFVIQQICDLARGDKSQQEITALLESKNIDINAIPPQGSLSSLLINGNKPAQAYACATYLATALFQPVDNSTLYQQTKDKTGKLETTLDVQKFTRQVRVKMSMAQATAQLYAVIAANLPADSNQSWADNQRSVANTVYNYAPEYLRLVKVLYDSDNAKYSPGAITKSTMSVADNQGRELQLTPRGPVLISRGVVWLGNGKILGEEYFAPVKIINTIEPVKEVETKESLPQEKENRKKRTLK